MWCRIRLCIFGLFWERCRRIHGEYLSLCFGEKFLPELLQASPCGRYQPDKTYRTLIYMGSLQYEEGEDLFGKVQDCLRKLPEQQRKVLEMKIFRDMSYKEIARELNLSEVTVHTHVKRAYKAIREALPVVYFLWSVLGKI